MTRLDLTGSRQSPVARRGAGSSSTVISVHDTKACGGVKVGRQSFSVSALNGSGQLNIPAALPAAPIGWGSEPTWTLLRTEQAPCLPETERGRVDRPIR